MALTAKQKSFVQEYLVDLNATQAAIRAGYSVKTAEAIGHENLKKPKIAELIQKSMDERAAKVEITADMVLQRWWDIATADPNDIIHLRRTCCRYCFGKDHQYQWKDEAEYERAVRRAEDEAQRESEEKDKPVAPLIPSDEGGYGFDELERPHPKCPNCLGEGREDIHIEDTRHLTGKAKLLYAGLKTTNTGIEIKMQDQGKALENVARHLGMFNDKLKLEGGLMIKQKLEDFFN
ncbi:terminase small subunit [Paenibacillus sp. F4]|uniref:terminase small subunit n=1 Tax=Paenibacillus sp. F4 TaxID=357385 RepID=UPI000C9FE000|nr:terminase small subunit [Paenibacillus sp. F4]PNQ82685.1 terminase small subunit [Paenibacillus sp. F4]